MTDESRAAVLVPATTLALAVDRDGPLCGIALLGPSGMGKTQLALSLIADCRFGRTALISDDMSALSEVDGTLWAEPAPRLAGAVELRGTGIAIVPYSKRTRLKLAFQLAQHERQPDDLPPWAPLGAEGPHLPALSWRPGAEGFVPYIRSILAGHSRRGGFDSVPAN